MFRYLYKIKIGQNTLVFTSFDSAFEWCKKNTVWDNIKIRNSISRIEKCKGKDYYIM